MLQHTTQATIKRSVLLFALALLLGALAFAVRVSLEQAGLAARLIRLHVVAASDDPADQARKLAVRDALLPELAALTADCPDAEAAVQVLGAALPELAETAARALGTGEPVRVTLAREPFPRREYETFALPAGTYQALRVTLGAGVGHNWWCVAFPALCVPAVSDLEEAAVAAGITDTEYELMTSEKETVRFKFRVLDWLAELFG